jgi:hypothetical protein
LGLDIEPGGGVGCLVFVVGVVGVAIVGGDGMWVKDVGSSFPRMRM